MCFKMRFGDGKVKISVKGRAPKGLHGKGVSGLL